MPKEPMGARGLSGPLALVLDLAAVSGVMETPSRSARRASASIWIDAPGSSSTAQAVKRSRLE
jgi:hypothetical protein